jgi:hypothetical protein
MWSVGAGLCQKSVFVRGLRKAQIPRGARDDTQLAWSANYQRQMLLSRGRRARIVQIRGQQAVEQMFAGFAAHR